MNTKLPWYRSPYTKAVLLAFLMFLMIVLYTLEFNYLSNTFHVDQLLMVSLVLGIIAGIAVGMRVKVFSKNREEKVVYFVLAFILCILITPLLFSMTNRLLSFHAVQKEAVEFVASKAFGMKRFGVRKETAMKVDGYHLFFLREGNVERIKSEKELFPGKVGGDQILLPVKKGLFGFSYVVLSAIK